MFIGSRLLFVYVGSLTVRAIGSKPLTSIGDANFSWVKLHRLSECTETLTALRGPGIAL
jgi:hypothetical protein